MAKKIVIIDDEPEICIEVCDYLKEMGYEALFANNGEEGLKLIEKEEPQMVLLDIRMPGMDGIEVMRQIIEKYPNLVILILSGVHDIEIAKRAIEYGACEYVTKPIRMEELTEKFIRPILGD